MAFDKDGWNPIGGQSKQGNAPAVYSYTTTDAIADVNTSGYFNDFVDILNVGDLIYCVTSTGTTAVATLAYVVSNDGTDVDVVNGTTLANTNAD